MEDVIPKKRTIAPKKIFKDYEPGIPHIVIKYVRGDMTETSSVDSLRRLERASLIRISKILTDDARD
jgi:hypothetical protein